MQDKRVAQKIRAEMARGGLLKHQLRIRNDPELGYVDPREDPEVLDEVFRFLHRLDDYTKTITEQ